MKTAIYRYKSCHRRRLIYKLCISSASFHKNSLYMIKVNFKAILTYENFFSKGFFFVKSVTDASVIEQQCKPYMNGSSIRIQILLFVYRLFL